MTLPYESFYINNDRRVFVTPVTVDGVADTGISTYTAYLYSAADKVTQAAPLATVPLVYVSDITSPFHGKYTGIILASAFTSQPLSSLNRPDTMGRLRVVALQSPSHGEENTEAYFTLRGNS
jgi:hypothetical protein